MAASATGHVALAPSAGRALGRRRIRAPPTKATGVLASAHSKRVTATPVPSSAQPRVCARTGQAGIVGAATPTPTRRWRPRGSVLVGVRGGSEAEWEEGWRSGAGRGRGRSRAGASNDTPADPPADVFATVVIEGFGVSSTLVESSTGDDAETADTEQNQPGRKRAWLKKTVWKALSGEEVSVDNSRETQESSTTDTLENRQAYPEADGGALNGGMEEERERESEEKNLNGDLNGAQAAVGSIIAASVQQTNSEPEWKPMETNATRRNGKAHKTGNNGENKKKDKRYLAVNPPKPYEVMRINAPDAVDAPGTHRAQKLTRRALLRDAELTPRDLRRIDPSLLQTTNTPALLVKDQTIMVNLGVRVIIRPDHALLFEPDTDTGRRFLNAVDTRKCMEKNGGSGDVDTASSNDSMSSMSSMSASHDSSTSDTIDFDYDLNATPGGTGGAPIPFELEMVEAALQETMSQLYAKLEFCEERCKRVSSQLRSSINPAVLEELRLTKQSLVALDSRAGSVRQVLLDTLDDDDDIADFTISSTATSEEDKEDEEEEVENLIEYYLQQTETVHNAAEQLLENTRDLEESISVSLSSRRYEVSKLELTLSIATFAAALGALVTGIFGMNLRSCLEMSISAFYLTCFLIVTGIGGIFKSIMNFARKQKIL